MRALAAIFASVLLASFAAFGQQAREKEKLYLDPINVVVPTISTDKFVKYDFDIVYVRALRAGDDKHKRYYTDFSQPVTMEPGADLMLLHPDGSEELLVKGGDGSITDPVMSFDAQWVYFSHIHDLRNRNQWNPPKQGADIYKIHLKTRRIVKLTNQKFTPNLGAANWSKDFRTPEKGRSHFEYGVFNTGPCPLPGGRIAFTSNRDGFRPAQGYPAIALQLFVMDDRDTDIGDTDDPVNLEKIGHLNLAGALHPVALKDGRIMYSTLESQGSRSDILWGIWTIHPDGTQWNPLVSAFDPGGAPNGFHFQTQLSNEDIVVEEYYNQNNSGFGTYIKLHTKPFQRQLPPETITYGPALTRKDYARFQGDYPSFAPADMNSTQGWRFGRFDNGKPRTYRMPFMPLNSVSLTPFTHPEDGPANRSVRGDKSSPAVGKFTHPSAAPDNHLLTCYSPGPVNHQYNYPPQLDGGIYLIKGGNIVNEPAQMRLIKNDPNFNECWPRAVVPYRRIYELDEPVRLGRLKNDGAFSKELPEGTPFALVGTSSFYKRESYPNGAVLNGRVTATFAGNPKDPWKGLDAFTSHGNGPALNWHNQGADAGLYTNDEIHAVRVLAMEPTTDRKGADSGRRYYNHAGERLRVLGEIPLRKFHDGKQPLDPDGNPDTSFLAKIPADVGFTFQTLDKRGLVLNAAQTWHQLRPGEVRNDCGGCHAHSQKPTDFNLTLASKADYKTWDLVNSTPVLTEKKQDESQQKWDMKDEAGLRYVKGGPLNIEYWRDVKPILARSCAACHTSKGGQKPKADLDLDADEELVQVENLGKFPGTFYRLAMDERAKYGIKPVGYPSWGQPNASRYVRKFQSRRSLLVWKIHGERLDGFTNDDHPSESEPGSGKFKHRGEDVPVEKARAKYDLDYVGKPMPAGVNVSPLTDEDRRTIARWIDLGCPIDLDYDAKQPEKCGFGWMLDDQRPTLSLVIPPKESRILVGMHDYGTGLNADTFRVTADVEIDGAPSGENLATKFKPASQGVWELKLSKALPNAATITVSVADKQGNVTRVQRTLR